jgi:hypothetical protein
MMGEADPTHQFYDTGGGEAGEQFEWATARAAKAGSRPAALVARGAATSAKRKWRSVCLFGVKIKNLTGPRHGGQARWDKDLDQSHGTAAPSATS